MLLYYKIFLVFAFFIQKILNKICDIKNCEGCQLISEENNGQLYCKCEKCFGKKYNSICSSKDCDYCLKFSDKIYYNDCFCIMCKGSKNPLFKEENDNNHSSFPYYIIPIILFIILFIPVFYCCLKRKRNNRERRKLDTNRHLNNNRNIRFVMDNNVPNSCNRALRVEITNIISHENVINVKRKEKKEIKVDDILNNEKYLGPKRCKKEYEKYNILCTICLDKFKEEIDMISLTPCSHLFHNKCLIGYFKNNKSAKCPNCNFDIIKYYQNIV